MRVWKNGKALEEGLKRAGVEYSIYKIQTLKYKEKKGSVIFGDDEDKQTLLKFGVDKG